MSTNQMPLTGEGSGADSARWWHRACGGREVLVLAFPLILSTASWAVMHFVDRMFLFWLSPLDTAAALSSGTILWTMMALPLGMASYLNTFVSQYFGAGQLRRLGLVLYQGLAFGWVTVPVFALLIPLSDSGFLWLGHDEAMTRREVTYFQVNCVGAGAAVIAAAYASFYTGRGQMRTVMVIDVSASLANAVLDYALIFGTFGFPELGIAGAAWATVAAQWGKVAAYWLLLRAPDLRIPFGLDEGRRLDRPLLSRLIRFGAPNGFQLQLEGLAFTIFVIYVARLGTVATAATTLAISVNIVAFVPMMGLGLAVSTLVGQHLGAGQPGLAAQAAWSGLWLSLAYNAVFAWLYLATPDLFLLAHTAVAASAETAAVRELTALLLRFVAAYCLFDAVQLIFCSVIKGAGDTRFVLLTTLATSFGAVAAIEWGLSRLDWGLLWCWTVLVVWIVSLAVAYTARFLQGGWMNLRVIEPELCVASSSGDPA